MTAQPTTDQPTKDQIDLAIGGVTRASCGDCVDHEQGETEGALRRRLIIVTALAVPVLVLSMVPLLQFTHWQWISLALTGPAVVWGAWPLHHAAWMDLRRGVSTRDTLASVGTLAALGWSVGALLFGSAGASGMTYPFRLVGERMDAGRALYLGVAAALTAFGLAGRYLEARSQGRGGAAAARMADRVAGVLLPVVIAVAVATLGFWLGTGTGVATASGAAVAVVIIGCPCALGLATQAALLMGTGRGAQLGVLIKGFEVLESAKSIDIVVLDKTGTLTTGRMVVHRVVKARAVTSGVGAGGVGTGGVGAGGENNGADGDEALRMAASVEQGSDHPVGRAIVAAAGERLGPLPDVAEFDSSPGRGVRGVVSELDGDVVVAHAVLVGSPALLTEYGVALPEDLDEAVDAARAQGLTAVAVAWDGVARATIVVGDTVADGSADAVARLYRLGLRPVLLTGDHRSAGLAVAAQVGIAPDDVIAEVSPEEKVTAIAALQADGWAVAVIGEGVDDARALAVADLGIAMGTDATIEAADIALVRGGLPAAVDALRLARRTLTAIKGNLIWALAYNVAALPLAASGLLSPTIVVAAMAFSSVFVVTNSWQLSRFRPIHAGPDHPKVATDG